MSKVMDIKKERGDIAIVPEIEELARTFNAEMRVTESEPPGEVAFLEWAMAAAVALFLARPFFEEIMKELGKKPANESPTPSRSSLRRQRKNLETCTPLRSLRSWQKLRRQTRKASWTNYVADWVDNTRP
jgi:hypothetical protein